MSPRSKDVAIEERLATYRAKRSPGATPEPFGGEESAVAGVFVVQKHAARRTHYDLRLEFDGVLKSWAVPKGPCLDPEEKRLAVETEDHPVAYADFEGVIPAGNYGAGAMIVWDRGTWIALEDFASGLDRGKLLFELRGYKLRGAWTLFRTKRPAIHRGKSKNEDRQWLLVKKPDGAARRGAEPLAEESVLSGLTVEELREGPLRLDELRRDIEASGGRRARLELSKVKLMLAQPAETPFSRRGWVFELKYDGYRLLASKEEAGTRLRYRNGHDATDIFPEITRALDALPAESFLIDGEVVVLDDEARPSFQALQKRALLSRPLEARRAAAEMPATLYAFDLVAFEGLDLRTLPLRRRKDFLRRLLPPAGPIRYCDHVEERGEELFVQIETMGLEGMVAKDGDSPYVGRRSSSWLKFRVDRVGDFVVVGWTEPKGTRTRAGFASLHVAAFEEADSASGDGPQLVYAGRVGSGFGERDLEEIRRHLESRERSEPPCRGETPKGGRNRWVEPDLVCEVRFKEWTDQGMLRHPVFLRLRDDKPMEECTGERRRTPPQVAVSSASSTSASADENPPAGERQLQLTNLEKVFWPDEGYTKGDLIDYYRAVAPAMLPYLADRPIVLTRYPDGIFGKNFFQKNAPDFAPDWVRTVTIWSEGSEREIDYFVVDDADVLVFIANLGAILIHMWSSRLAELSRPDWCILDLDPKEAPFGDVVAVAKEIHSLCEEIDLPSFVKTSGSSGLHVLLPLGASCTYEQSRLLGQLIAQIIAGRIPDVATTTRNPRKRQGKVYIDHVQNGHGRLLVAPFSLRPLPAAPVSTPLRWHEVNGRLKLENHTIRSVPRRLRRLDDDPLLPVLTLRPDLPAILQALATVLEDEGR